jgi:hypothetical protein
MSDGTAAMSDATSDERVRNQQEQSRRNNGPSDVKRLTARFDELRNADAVRRAKQ